jgi:hypothetical protein
MASTMRRPKTTTNGHGKAGASKAPAKDGHGVEITHVDEDNSDDDESTSAGARNWRGPEPWQLQPSSTAG